MRARPTSTKTTHITQRDNKYIQEFNAIFNKKKKDKFTIILYTKTVKSKICAISKYVKWKEHNTRYVLIFIPVYLSEIIIYFIHTLAPLANCKHTGCNRVNASRNLQNLFQNIFVDEFS